MLFPRMVPYCTIPSTSTGILLNVQSQQHTSTLRPNWIGNRRPEQTDIFGWLTPNNHSTVFHSFLLDTVPVRWADPITNTHPASQRRPMPYWASSNAFDPVFSSYLITLPHRCTRYNTVILGALKVGGCFFSGE